MHTLASVQAFCISHLRVNNDGNASTELFDAKLRREIALSNLRYNSRFYNQYGEKYKVFRQRVELATLVMQDPCSFTLVKGNEARDVDNVYELRHAYAEGFTILKDAYINPCGEVALSRWDMMQQGYATTGGSPYSKELNNSQQRLIARAVWRRLNIAARDSVIVEALPHMKLSKSVMTKLERSIYSTAARELVFTFYNQTRKPQWWPILRSFRSGLKGNDNHKLFCLLTANYIYDALGLQSPMKAEWRTETVINLVKAMRESEDFSLMPILADALQDAGCDNEALLVHYRSPDSSFSLASWIFRATGVS